MFTSDRLTFQPFPINQSTNTQAAAWKLEWNNILRFSNPWILILDHDWSILMYFTQFPMDFHGFYTIFDEFCTISGGFWMIYTISDGFWSFFWRYCDQTVEVNIGKCPAVFPTKRFLNSITIHAHMTHMIHLMCSNAQVCLQYAISYNIMQHNAGCMISIRIQYRGCL